MDVVFKKIGLYDVWTVYFPGAVSLILQTFTVCVFRILKEENIRVLNMKLFLPKDVSEWIVFSILAILLGIIFQESGRIMRIILKLHNASEGLLDPEKGVFSAQEIATFSETFVKYGYNGENKSTAESRRLFHCLNINAQKKGVADMFVKLNIIEKMSLSLSAILAFNSILFVGETAFFVKAGNRIGIFVTMLFCAFSVFLTFVFFMRSKRFNYYWVRNIVFAMATNNC